MNKAYLSIIIPVLNEIEQLEELLTTLKDLSVFRNEVIIVDGGSTDGSYEWLEEKEGITLIQSQKGRAHQQNEGAKVASSEVLYFLHADTRPPKGFDEIIHQAYIKNSKAGSFRLRFSSKHWALNIAAHASRFNNRYCRGGDQSLFIQKKLFNSLNGFNEDYIICEDGELIDRIYKQYSFCVLPQEVITSSRRFKENGVIRLQFHFMMIHVLRALGKPPTALHKYYCQFVK